MKSEMPWGEVKTPASSVRDGRAFRIEMEQSAILRRFSFKKRDVALKFVVYVRARKGPNTPPKNLFASSIRSTFGFLSHPKTKGLGHQKREEKHLN